MQIQYSRQRSVQHTIFHPTLNSQLCQKSLIKIRNRWPCKNGPKVDNQRYRFWNVSKVANFLVKLQYENFVYLFQKFWREILEIQYFTWNCNIKTLLIVFNFFRKIRNSILFLKSLFWFRSIYVNAQNCCKISHKDPVGLQKGGKSVKHFRVQKMGGSDYFSQFGQ